MKARRISLGHTASHSPAFVQLPNISRSIAATMLRARAERSGAPGLERQAIAVPEAPHVELADGGRALGSVRDAVDHEATRAADTLAAVVLERDRRLAAIDQLLVDDVEHLEKGHVRADVLRLVGDQAAAGAPALLAPHPERQGHR